MVRDGANAARIWTTRSLPVPPNLTYCSMLFNGIPLIDTTRCVTFVQIGIKRSGARLISHMPSLRLPPYSLLLIIRTSVGPSTLLFELSHTNYKPVAWKRFPSTPCYYQGLKSKCESGINPAIAKDLFKPFSSHVARTMLPE